MEPISAAAIATLVITKAFEKTGEKLGERALEQAAKLVNLLKDRFPEAVAIVTQTQNHPDSPIDIGVATLEIENAAKQDAEVAELVQVLAKTVGSPQFLPNITNQAEKVGLLIQNGSMIGSTVNQTNHF